MKRNVTIGLDVPEGHEVIGYRVPKAGESYLWGGKVQELPSNRTHIGEAFILRKVNPLGELLVACHEVLMTGSTYSCERLRKAVDQFRWYKNADGTYAIPLPPDASYPQFVGDDAGIKDATTHLLYDEKSYEMDQKLGDG